MWNLNHRKTAAASALEYIITHVFLPPKLPQEDDSDYQQDSALVEECRAALRSFQEHLPDQERLQWVALMKMLDKALDLRDVSGNMLTKRVELSLEAMETKDLLAFHIRSQNAGLIVRRLPDRFSFESFELSPTTIAVITTKGRLRRCFPGPAVAIGQDRIEDASFRRELAQLLNELDATTPMEARAVMVKAHKKTPEIRDSLHPKFVTEMLTGILRGIGQVIDVDRIHKRTRDDVLWDGVLKPWRRSPLWLLLRVALQTHLRTGLDDSHKWYKSFMIYFMTHILQRALDESLPSDILFVMAAKISRRVLKLNIGSESTWVKHVHGTIEAVHLELAERWEAIEQNPDPLGVQKIWKNSKLSFFTDTHLALSTLRPYLASITTRKAIPSGYTKFKHNCHPRIIQNTSTFPQLGQASDDNARLLLADLELWVQDWLDYWQISDHDFPSSCTVLADLIDDYTKIAANQYVHNPEDMSLMFLTTMELWIALDKCTACHYPLLTKYDPGFPPSLLDSLLLPKRSQMQRLARVEQYLKDRREKSIHESSLIFEQTHANKSLAAQFYNESQLHKRLREKIEVAATIEREQKKIEFVEKRKEYDRLRQESQAMSCEETTRRLYGRLIYEHDPQECQKCQLDESANNLQITVHEWPLPSADVEAKIAVFELEVPASIAEWRDTTYALLVDVFASPIPQSLQHGPKKVYTLQNFNGLTKYAKFRTRRRLQLASTSKPFTVAHYGRKKLSEASETDICVPNGLNYSMYDSVLDMWTTELFNRCNIWEVCTFQLPPGPYRTLQYALDGTIHSSNEVLATQAKCPKMLNLHEFYSFATLRSGDRLQWRSIARELVSGILDFNHEETYMLVAQTAWQAGRFKDGGCYRETHADLEEEEFGTHLLSALGEALGAVEGNWQGASAARIFILLAIRLLSMTLSPKVCNGCYSFLRRARYITLQWTRDVSQLLHEAQDNEELKAMELRVLEMALTCHSTFHVDKYHLSMLLTSSEDVSVVTECSIIIHDRSPTTTEQLPRSIKTMLQRHEKRCHLLEPSLREKILVDRAGVDSTLHRIWTGYRQGSPWAAMKSPGERWLATETSSEKGLSRMTVHFNILDGSLLVNGSPLTRLPRPYELHSTYRRLFGEKILDVIPSTMPGMVFETRNDVCGQQVHFRISGSELIIRAYNQGQVYEVLPIHALYGDFPSAFVHDYVHWLDIDTGIVEWRLLNDVWTPSPDNWQMVADGQGQFSLCRGPMRLMDICSNTAITISKLLSPLEDSRYIHIISNHEAEELQVNLPRLKLDFALHYHGSLLESKQFRGMVVDECQSFGALTGLRNKLVLREANGMSRSVIVPHGSVFFLPDGHHVQVTIDTASLNNVKYHSYHIDSQLGRLVDNGSLRSRLFRLYLHATTAHCLIDHLTGRTGTEEALCGLMGSATRSFVELEPEDIKLLQNLSQLTPRRRYYPEHLQVMQQVKWLNLPSLLHHHDFYVHVESIFHQARLFYMFQEHSLQPPSLDIPNEKNLLKRAAIRDSSFQVYGFGGETFTTSYDVDYAPRDRDTNGTRERQTCHTANLVDSWSTNLAICTGLLSQIESWNTELSGPRPEDDLNLGFDLDWLDMSPDKFLPSDWCTLHTILSESMVERDKYKIMIFLGTLSYSQYANQELVETLLALATVPGLRSLKPPDYPTFRLSDGYGPQLERLIAVVEGHARQFYECPEANLPALSFESKRSADRRRKRDHQVAKSSQIRMFVGSLVEQWPDTYITSPIGASHSKYIEVDEATESARACFQSWHRNALFKGHIKQIQTILNSLTANSHQLQKYFIATPVDNYISSRRNVSFEDLVRNNAAPDLLLLDQGNFDEWVIRSDKLNNDHDKLRGLLDRISSRCTSGHEQRYARDLLKSFEALHENTSVELKLPQESIELLTVYLEQARSYLEMVHRKICTQLQSGPYGLLRKAKMLPRLSPTAVLSHLARDEVGSLPYFWKKALVTYGCAITTVQRAERLLGAARSTAELLSELQNPGHQDWDPMDYPDWLLLEVENNILIRQEQAQISKEMISPSSQSNSVMQLNMGLGKSSVSVPISVAALADKTKLVRVIVLKPLAMQMFQLLTKKLGGMLNRRIFYMPISRSLSLDVIQAHQIRNLYEECMQTGGILLVQPEHILSFELMGLERLISGNSEIGNVMIETQDWLRAKSRDILDESDEILSVRFELIYTMGTQRAIEFSPDRWDIVQHVLYLLGGLTDQVREQFPHGLEVVPQQPGSFPKIRILESQAGDKLMEIVAWRLCEATLPGVPMSFLPSGVRMALFKFLTDPKLDAASTKLLLDTASGSDTMRKGLLLLKGLFADGILKFAFGQKRWRVNYGLDLSRTMLAVPYHAKDTPATRAEFSHPDAAIVLTYLSYYYGGLSDQQIRSSFEALLKSNNATEEYARWVRDAPKLPAQFKQITGINLSNTTQCSREVFPPLRFARGVINFYMAAIVFPAEMKDFPHKLSSSGWDIVQEKVNPTTGFSGTNDSKYILPLSVTQCDLPPQLSTNAEVLDCLLRSENSFVEVHSITGSEVLDAEVLIQTALKLDPPIRVIIDVGAQVLELHNEGMARAWLSRVSEAAAQAVIFFDNRNEICVLGRDGTIESLLVSPFLNQMDHCLVYLDEAHTRGTDLKMPVNYRAIVTLGPRLTKDRLVQVQRSILESCGKSSGDIVVADVLEWCIAETCAYTRKCIPLWATQGVRNQRRHVVCSRPFDATKGFPRDLAESLLEPEAQSLQQRYGSEGKGREEQILLAEVAEGPLKVRAKQLAAIRAKCLEFEVRSFGVAALQEEQERELSPENEREQQVELPPASTPCKHSIHEDVLLLAMHGLLRTSSKAFLSAFDTLRNTTAFKYCKPTAWPKSLLVTADFAQTVKAPANEPLDSFLRPVNWIISLKRKHQTEFVIVSPHEAQELLPSIRKHKAVTLHIYAPRLSESMRSLEDLSFCTIPPVLRSWPTPTITRELNLFAGQLYIRAYHEYESLCSFLGLCSQPSDDSMQVSCDGFIAPLNNPSLSSSIIRVSPFTTSQVTFLRTLVALRRKGQSFKASHLGMILNGELLEREHFNNN